jgi:hypothetical protein
LRFTWLIWEIVLACVLLQFLLGFCIPCTFRILLCGIITIIAGTLAIRIQEHPLRIHYPFDIVVDNDDYEDGLQDIDNVPIQESLTQIMKQITIW